jgi:hypothetical protein
MTSIWLIGGGLLNNLMSIKKPSFWEDLVSAPPAAPLILPIWFYFPKYGSGHPAVLSYRMIIFLEV